MGHLRAICGTEHEAHLPGIYDGFVFVAIVKQDMHLARLRGYFSDSAGPEFELIFGVEIIETLSRANAFLLPGLDVRTKHFQLLLNKHFHRL